MSRRRSVRRHPPQGGTQPLGGTQPSSPWTAPAELHALLGEQLDALVAIAARLMIAVVVFDSTLTASALKRLGAWNGERRTMFALSEQARTRIIAESGRAGDLRASAWFAAKGEPNKARLLLLIDHSYALEHLELVFVPSSMSTALH